jgi:hypothetical protein
VLLQFDLPQTLFIVPPVNDASHIRLDLWDVGFGGAIIERRGDMPSGRAGIVGGIVRQGAGETLPEAQLFSSTRPEYSRRNLLRLPTLGPGRNKRHSGSDADIAASFSFARMLSAANAC